eukprot:gnl/TRDRNA2_/TRDRNA2_140193_c0_seq1.p1 gnl/TRDRNA2_/TRDRNA2_140193_c0~~gnl/TRDRNA2_/TRDRNA2_140193_c0_seq1.p1  ORF type:complete len:575 (+),score=55.89 gnl/TRDRNA2_/TRDRNA2_140193_c0_seq1:244-1725(+)
MAAFPAARLGSFGFLMPCVVTVVTVCCLQRSLHDVDKVRPQLVPALGAVAASDPGRGRLPTLLETDDASRSDLTIALPAVERSSYIVPGVLILWSCLNFVAFVIAAKLVDPATAAPLWGAGATPSTWSPESGSGASPGTDTGVSRAMLTPEPVPLSWASRWPAFWEPTGAAWWPDRQALILVGGSVLVEMKVDGAVSGDGAELSTPRHVYHDAPLADVCIAGHMPGWEGVWLASSDVAFTVMLSHVNNSTSDKIELVMPVGPVRHLFHDAHHLDGSEQVGMPPARAGPAPRALGCHTRSSMRELPARDEVALWLAINEAAWPQVLGAVVATGEALRFEDVAGNRTVRTSMAATGPVLATYKWPSEWLAADPSLAQALAPQGAPAELSVSATVESIEPMAGGGLLILVTGAYASAANMPDISWQALVPPPQVLVAIDTKGQISHWWQLTAPGSGVAGAAGVGRWVAMAADIEGERIFLVAGGPRPRVSVTSLPA